MEEINFELSKRFQEYMPRSFCLYETEEIQGNYNIFAYYIGDDKKAKISEIYGVCDTSLKEVCIVDINSKIPNIGLGTILLYLAIITAREKGAEKVYLDDDSDNYRKERNIYINIGLKYCESDGPEMEGNTNDIKKRWDNIKKKYERTT